MPYTNDPANDPADAVRFLVGDTDTANQELTDEEVAFLLYEEGDNLLRAAARAAETLSAKYAKTSAVTTRQVGPLRITTGSQSQSRSAELAKLAKLLWARANAAAGSGFVYAGGISVADKRVRELNSDRVRPSFTRRMMNPAGGDTSQASRDDLLGPDYS